MQGLSINPADWNKELSHWRVWVSFKSNTGFAARAGTAAPLINSKVFYKRMVIVYITSTTWKDGDIPEVYRVGMLMEGEAFQLVSCDEIILIIKVYLVILVNTGALH